MLEDCQGTHQGGGLVWGIQHLLQGLAGSPGRLGEAGRGGALAGRHAFGDGVEAMQPQVGLVRGRLAGGVHVPVVACMGQVLGFQIEAFFCFFLLFFWGGGFFLQFFLGGGGAGASRQGPSGNGALQVLHGDWG